MNFTCIVAADTQNGIGYQGNLPWPRLPPDMAFFKKMTVGEDPATKKNAIVMGRKTWDSIPVNFRPLPDRINIVLSSTMTVSGENFSTSLYICRKGLDEAIALAEDLHANEIFIGGGGEVYKQAFKDPRCKRVLLTRIGVEFPSDVFIPDVTADFKLATTLDRGEHRGKNSLTTVPYAFEEWLR